MRSVSGETRRRGRVSLPRTAPAGRAVPEAVPASSAIAVTVSDAIQRLDLLEIVVHDLELLAQPLDVAVDGAIIDIDVLAIGGVHQLVAALDMAGTRRERLQDQKLGD